MSVLFIIVPVALFVVLVAVLGYLWAARHGEFDDLTTPAVRMLHDDPPAPAAAEGDSTRDDTGPPAPPGG